MPDMQTGLINGRYTFFSAVFALTLSALPALSQGASFNQVLDTGGANIAAVQDQDGFMWFATHGALVRFDGKSKLKFRAGPGSVASSLMPSLLVDRDGLLWIMTGEVGLNIYDKSTNSFKLLTHDTDDPRSISSNYANWAPKLLAEDTQGHIWVGTQNGLNKYDKRTGAFSRYLTENQGLPEGYNDIHVVHASADGSIWVGTGGAGLFQYDPARDSFTHYRHNPEKNSLTDDFIYAIDEDQTGNLWIGTRKGGLNKLNLETGEFSAYRHDPDDPRSLANDEVYFILVDQEGILWIGRSFKHQLGLERFDPKANIFETFTYNPLASRSISGDAVLSVYEDPAGILWIPVNSGPVDIIDKAAERFTKLEAPVVDPQGNPLSLQIHRAQSFVEAPTGEMWIGTTQGLFHYQPDNELIVSYAYDPRNPEAIPNNDVSSVIYHDSDHLWVGTIDGILSLFHIPSGKVVERYRPDVDYFGIWDLQRDINEPRYLWFGTETRGIFKFDTQSHAFENLTKESHDFGSNWIETILQEPGRGLWLSTTGGGLVLIDSEGKILDQFVYDEGNTQSISSDTVKNSFIDSKGRFWVTTNNGLNQFDPETRRFERFDRGPDFTTPLLYTILESEDGLLWISSDEGLFLFDPDRQRATQHFLKVDGLPNDAFFPFSTSAEKDSQGRLWLSSVDGIMMIDPKGFALEPHLPPIAITSLTQGGEAIETETAAEHVESIVLDWRKNYFEFEFVALNYSLAQRVWYRYRLMGFEDEWYQSERRSFGRYSNLPGGKYTLQMQASNSTGEWKGGVHSIDVVVLKPWWEQTWFIAVVFFATLLLLTGGYVANRNRKAAQHALKEGEARILLEEAEKERVKLELQSREIMLERANSAVGVAFIVYDFKTRHVVYASNTFKHLIGVSDDMYTSILDNIDNLFRVVPESQKNAFISLVQRAESDNKPYETSFRISEGPAKGRSIQVRSSFVPGLGSSDTSRVTVFQDVSEAVETEDQLRQALKLEAIGKLTGGVAHDFNNLLAIVYTSAELLTVGQTYDPDLVEQILSACTRGSELTQSLLAYARKQSLNARAIDFAHHSKELENFLNRALGEDIDLKVYRQADLWLAYADPGQLNDAILNLAINARDAMKNGGVLTIEFNNATLESQVKGVRDDDLLIGDFVTITVTDNGSGMPEEVVQRATDPFFTTKPVGEGTGLGLSMVYGFVKQSGGGMTIYSDLDNGTVIRLYLPRYENDENVEMQPDGESDEVVFGNNELIVIVEDDVGVRTMSEKMLASLGYRTLSFSEAGSALDYFRNGGTCDLVLSDIILPGGLRGTELAKIIRSEFDKLPLLLISGFPMKNPNEREFVELEIDILKKPISRKSMARVVAAALDSVKIA